MLDLSPGFSMRIDDEARELVIEGYDYDPMSTDWNPNYRIVGRIKFDSLDLISLRPEPTPPAESGGMVEVDPTMA